MKFTEKKFCKPACCIIFAALFFVFNFSLSPADPENEDPSEGYKQIISDFTEGNAIALGSGTGFFVAEDMVVTNAHVVPKCDMIRIRGAIKPDLATVVNIDKENDLALLKTTYKAPSIAALRGNKPIEVGEQANVMGYPLGRGVKGSYLIRKATVTDNSNENYLLITDSVQHGNSGGPLLDTSGTVIGVIVATQMLYKPGADMKTSTPVKVSGVAITLNKLKVFLNNNGIFYHTDDTNSPYSDSYMESKARDYIVNVQCFQHEPEQN